MDVAQPVDEFFANIVSALEWLQSEGSSTPDEIKAAIQTAQDEATDSVRGDARIIQWFLKMRDHMTGCASRETSALEKVASFGLFEETDLIELHRSMGTDAQATLWELINNINCMCVLYDQKTGDEPFRDITKFAQHLLTLFPKEELKTGGQAEIIKHIPALIDDETMRVLIGKVCMNDDRMDRVFALMELQFGTAIPAPQRAVLSTTLQAAASALENDETRTMMAGLTDVLPDMLKAGQGMLEQLLTQNPSMQAMADLALGTMGAGGDADLAELEAAATAAAASLGD